jgi:hypothetical protein
MSSIERVEQRIAELVAASGVPEDPSHSQNTLEWLLDILKWRRCSCDAPGFIELFCGAPRLLGLPIWG